MKLQPKTDDELLGPAFRWRLRATLDRVEPKYSSPRYQTVAGWSYRTWRIAPAMLAAALGGVVALSVASTGSVNPVVWTEHAGTIFIPSTHEPEGNPGGGAPAQNPPSQQPKAAPTQPAHPAENSSPKGSGEAEGTPRPTQSPEPTDERPGGSSSNPTSSTTPTPTPTPPPHGD